MRIELHNRQRTVNLDLPRLRAMLDRSIANCVTHTGRGGARLAVLDAVEVTLVSDRKIAELHRQFLQVSGPTDVITFEHGEIVVSATTAAERCVTEGETLDREVARYIIHGLLHLNGHLDEEAADAKAMWTAQETVLDSLWPQESERKLRQRPGIASNK